MQKKLRSVPSETNFSYSKLNFFGFLAKTKSKAVFLTYIATYQLSRNKKDEIFLVAEFFLSFCSNLFENSPQYLNTVWKCIYCITDASRKAEIDLEKQTQTAHSALQQ